MILNAVRKLLPTAGSVGRSEDIERALAEITLRITEAESRLAEAEARRGPAALESDTSIARNRAAISAARDDIADLTAARGDIAAQLDKARAAERVAASEALYEQARQTQAATAKALKLRLRKHFDEHLALIELLETSRLLIRAANRDLPSGASYLADPEAIVRDRHREPRAILEEKKVERWVRCDNNQEIDPSKVYDFRRDEGPYGSFSEKTNLVGGQLYDISTFQRVRCIGQIIITRTIRDEGSYFSVPSISTLAMPNVRWDEPGYDPPISIDDPAFVLEAISRARSMHRDPEPSRAVWTEVTSEPIA